MPPGDSDFLVNANKSNVTNCVYRTTPLSTLLFVLNSFCTFQFRMLYKQVRKKISYGRAKIIEVIDVIKQCFSGVNNTILPCFVSDRSQ